MMFLFGDQHECDQNQENLGLLVCSFPQVGLLEETFGSAQDKQFLLMLLAKLG